MIDWNDYRFFLAVAETGSLSAAARRLKVSQPTVGRRLGELESRLGARLFDRLADGFRLTAAGERILDLARRMAEDALTIERRVAGENEQLHGSVVLATSEGLGTCWLAPRLERMRARHPRIDLELVVGIGALDLLRREADVALRIGAPGADDVVGRRLGCIKCGLFAAGSYVKRHGTPERLADLAQHRIIESVRDIAHLRQAQMLRKAAAGARIALRCNNVSSQLAAARAGLGIMAVPFYMRAGAPELVRILADEFELEIDLWLLTHRDLRHTARVRAVLDLLAEEVRRDPDFRPNDAGIRAA